MDLLILILIFLLIGYLLASLGNSRASRKEVQAVTKPGWRDRMDDRWKASFDRRGLTDDFRVWVYGDPTVNLPDDFKAWFAGLPDKEAQAFTQALASYASGMGFSLSQLVRGGLDDEPIMRQVFVEAIVVYSSAYRKAKQAQQAVEAEQAKDKKHSGRGKKSAEKASSAPVNNAPETAEAPQAA